MLSVRFFQVKARPENAVSDVYYVGANLLGKASLIGNYLGQIFKIDYPLVQTIEDS